MFNLNQAITEWRRQLAAGGIKTPEVVDELESHLRDDVEKQMRSGSDSESAFKSAVQRLGEAHMLQGEFIKIETKNMQRLKVDRYCLRLASITVLVAGTIGLLRSEMDLKERPLGFSAVILSVLFLGSGRYISKFLPILSSKQIKIAHAVCGLAAIAWLVIYFYVILPQCNFTIGEVVVATIWAMTPCAMIGGITNGMDEAAFRSTHSVG